MQQKVYPGFSTSTGQAIIDILKTYYPELYKSLLQDPSSPLSFLVAIEQYLLEGSIEYARSLLKEQFIGTALSQEAVLLRAIESGYKPNFAKPASGQATLVIPVRSLSDGKVLLQNAFLEVQRIRNNLVGKHIVTNQEVPYAIKDDLQIFISPLSKLVKKIDPYTKTASILTHTVGTYSIAGNTYEALFVPLEVEQVELETIETTASYDSNYICSVDLPVELSKLAGIKVYIDNEEAELVPLLPLFSKDKYCFTLVKSSTGIRLILSNPVFGKTVPAGSEVRIELQKTLGKNGNIRANSLAFVQPPIDKFNGQQLKLYTIKHSNLENGQDLQVLKSDIYRFVQQSKRTITRADYFNVIKNEFGLPSLSIPRQSFSQNEVATYIALPKAQIGDLPRSYIRTSTKALVLKESDIQNFLLNRGSFSLTLPNHVLVEDYSIHPSGYFVRIRLTASPEELQSHNLNLQNHQSMWYPLFVYELDLTDQFFNHKVLNPLQITSNFTVSQVQSSGFFKGYSIVSQLLNFAPNFTSDTIELSGLIQLEISGGDICSILNLQSHTNPSAKVIVEITDETGQLTTSPLTTHDNGAEIRVDSCSNGILFISFKIRLPLVQAIYQFRPSILHTTVKIRQTTSENFVTVAKFTISNFRVLETLRNLPKVAKVEAIRSILPELNFASDDLYVIYDVPVIHYTDRNQYAVHVRNVLLEIQNKLDSLSPVTASNTVLLAQTYGYAYNLLPYNYSRGIDVQREGELVKLPITLEMKLSVFRDRNVQKVVDAIKTKLYDLINKQENPLISNISRHKIYQAVADIPNLVSFDLVQPEHDIVSYPPEYFEALQFRVFVPFVKYVDEESFVFRLTFV